jgi:hypothetical protein
MSAFNAQTAETIDGDVDSTPTTGRTIDLAPTSFEGTFRNPCFWILVGIAATLGVQYVLKKD